MKHFLNRIIVLTVTATLSSVIVLGKTTRKEVTFTKPVTVNGTVVKDGTYLVTFDDETNQLTISKGKKVIAKAEARIEKLEGSQTVYTTRSETDDPRGPRTLMSIALKDGTQATLLESSANKETTLKQ